MLEPGWIRLLSKELRRWLSMIEVQLNLVKGSAPCARHCPSHGPRLSPSPDFSPLRALAERERVRLPTSPHAPAWPPRWLTASVGRGSRPRGVRRGLTTSLEGSGRRRTSSSTRRGQREQAQSPAARTTLLAPHLPPTRTSVHSRAIPPISHSAPALLARLQALSRRERSIFAHAKARPLARPLPRPHTP